MNFLHIGLGSMGKRRVRNLQFLDHQCIGGYDLRKDRRQEALELYGVAPVESIQSVNWEEIDALIVSTPPDHHVEYAKLALEKGKHCFMEASVVDEGYGELKELARDSKLILAPSCTMRFDPLLVKCKEILKTGTIGQVHFANHHFGQYLPNWHPWETPKDFYVSKPETGAAREIVPFDLVFMVWLFGYPINLAAMHKNSGSLDLEIDDLYSLLYQTDQNIQVCVNIEVLSRVSYRYTKVVGCKGNIDLDFVEGKLSLFDADSGSWQIFRRDHLSSTRTTEEMYIREMECFVNACLGKEPWPFGLKDDHKVLNILYAAETSFKEQRIVKL